MPTMVGSKAITLLVLQTIIIMVGESGPEILYQ
jgi:hypothetical protein